MARLHLRSSLLFLINVVGCVLLIKSLRENTDAQEGILESRHKRMAAGKKEEGRLSQEKG